MAIHASILAWKIPWRGEPGRLQSMDCKGSATTKHRQNEVRGKVDTERPDSK